MIKIKETNRGDSDTMKKSLQMGVLTVILMLLLCSCQEKKQSEKEEPAASEQQEDIQEDTVMDTKQEEEGVPEETVTPKEEQDLSAAAFSFADLKHLQFCFSSGAGGWATLLNVKADGSFSGRFYDGDLGVTGDGYPNGTMYQSNFSGQFTQPEKINDYTYKVKIGSLSYAQKVGSEEIKDGMLYCYTDVYGLEGGGDILIYLPGAPLAELPEEFLSWVGYYDPADTNDTKLPFYALNNEAQQYGFSSYDIVENMRESLEYAQKAGEALEKELEEETLSQADLNIKSQELYELWDSTLNQLWSVLKQTLDKEDMDALTVQEREWIKNKEQEAAQAGAEAEGGSMQPMLVNRKAASLTKDRVYELMERLDP